METTPPLTPPDKLADDELAVDLRGGVTLPLRCEHVSQPFFRRRSDTFILFHSFISGQCTLVDVYSRTCQIVARRLTSIRGHCPTMYNVMPGPKEAASLVRQHGLSPSGALPYSRH